MSRIILFWVVALSCIGGWNRCLSANWSIRERVIVGRIPDSFSKYSGGPISSLSDEDVADGIRLGEGAKENPNLVFYAYLFKADRKFLASDAVYVSVRTPLALIAEHSLRQAREYRQADKAFIEFVRKLGVVSITLNNQFFDSRFRAVALNYDLILLRDGQRVEPQSKVPAWQGTDPFRSSAIAAISQDKSMDAIRKAAAQSMKASLAMVDAPTRSRMVAHLQETGWTASQIKAAFEWTDEEFAKYSTGNSSAGSPVASMVAGPGLFSIDEINKPGK